MPISQLGVHYINFGISWCTFFISLASFVAILINWRVDPVGNHFKSLLVGCNVLLTIAYITEQTCIGYPGMTCHVLMHIAVFLEFLLPVAMAMFFNLHLAYLFLDESLKKICFALIGVDLFQLVVNLFSPLIYKITSHNYYVRGPLFLLSQIFGALLILLAVWMILRHKSELETTDRFFAIAYLVFPVLGLLLQSLTNGVCVMVVATTLSVLMVSFGVQVKQQSLYYRNARELENVTLSLLRVQLKPHFVSNALSSISQLCKKDPEEAAVMIDRFADFLNKNLRDVDTHDTIPVQDELNHIENYLSIEKMRYGDRLRVRFNIEATNFRLPPLILQPIVENSIKHGLMAKEDGGTIVISTRQVGTQFLVSVSDNGMGFDTGAQNKDGRAHLGVLNVKRRLAFLEGANVMVHSRPGRGTTTTITLPGSVLYENRSSRR